MNKVTKKLIELSGAIPDSSGKWVPAESVEKLTKLMIEEFHAYVSTYYDESEPWITPGSILKHFGLEKEKITKNVVQ